MKIDLRNGIGATIMSTTLRSRHFSSAITLEKAIAVDIPLTMPTNMEDTTMMYPGGESAMAGTRMDRCAGCDATDVSLLACDDIQGPDGTSDPSKRARCVFRDKLSFSFPVFFFFSFDFLNLDLT